MVVKSTFDRTYWVIAELVSISEAKNGHLYLEIAEKENDFLQAKIRANIWSNTKKRILSEFEHITNQTIKSGMKVLINVTVEYHTVFGLSLNILDIDPNFSLGEIERQKQATLLQLEQEGLMDFNKQHVLPPVIQNIAIISSATAAGFQDFNKQLADNSYGYTFHTELFQATMQGENAANSIIQALDKIENKNKYFDVIVLIRGGGSSLDLSCFDEYSLAARLAQAHFAIFTGIGHERDTSIADKVAHTQLKTPTAVAEYIIAHNQDFESNLNILAESINQYALDLLDEQKQNIRSISRNLSYATQQKIHNNTKQITNLGNHSKQVVRARLVKGEFRLNKIHFVLKHDLKIKFNQLDQLLNQSFKSIVKEAKSLLQNHQKRNEQNEKLLTSNSLSNLEISEHNLVQINKMIQLADPKQILRKGFSITRHNGKVIRSIKNIEGDSILNTELCDGIIESKITNTHKNEQETDL